jgi:hypothetical protein
VRVALAGFLSALVVLALGCDADPGADPNAEPATDSERRAGRQAVTRDWHEVVLPGPAGLPGRLAVRDAVSCGGAWTAVGGVVLEQPLETRDARPAAWRSTDGRSWTALEVTATTYWGRRAILSTVACADGRVVAVGARSGGAHGNPRVTTFFEKEGGLDDQRAPFNLYGGATATNVGPITGADRGWLITGNRISGPAVWHSSDGRDFAIEEDVPGLADEEDFGALAQAATWDGERWVVVGGGNARSTLDRQPVVWVSADARSWDRLEVPGSEEFDDLERVVAVDEDLVALGLRGDAFGVWHRDDDSWGMGETFGTLPEDARSSPFVSSLVTGAGGLWATTSDGAGFALWQSTDGSTWNAVTIPEAPPETGGERILTVAANDDIVLLLADDGIAGRLWWSVE